MTILSIFGGEDCLCSVLSPLPLSWPEIDAWLFAPNGLFISYQANEKASNYRED